MPSRSEPRYADHPSWTGFKALLAARFGLRMQQRPRERFDTLFGHKIHIDDWTPAGPAKGTVLLVHGAGGHGRILAPLADRIAAQGWRVRAPDLPGYGLSVPAPSWRGAYDDWLRIVAHLADDAPAPVVLIGLSVGGMTAALAAKRMTQPVAGVLATTLLDLSAPAQFRYATRWPWLAHLSQIGFAIMPWIIDRLSAPLGLVAPLAKMSADPQITRYFKEDALLGRRWVSFGLFRAMARTPPPRALPCPLVLAHPGADDWTPMALSQETLATITSETRIVALPGGSHFPLETEAFEALMTEITQLLDHAAQHDRVARKGEPNGQNGPI